MERWEKNEWQMKNEMFLKPSILFFVRFSFSYFLLLCSYLFRSSPFPHPTSLLFHFPSFWIYLHSILDKDNNCIFLIRGRHKSISALLSGGKMYHSMWHLYSHIPNNRTPIDLTVVACNGHFRRRYLQRSFWRSLFATVNLAVAVLLADRSPSSDA